MNALPPGTVLTPMLLARCGAARESSARLQRRAQAVREASMLLRRLAGPEPRTKARCVVCGTRVSAREASRDVGRPAHASCDETRRQDIDALLLAQLASGRPGCRQCLAREVAVALDDVYAVSARLLARRKLRSAAGRCGWCHRPRLVFAVTGCYAEIERPARRP